MDARLLRSVLARPASPDADADLLRRFAQTRNEAAFAELVRRYGRLVWGVCRNLLPSEADAEDAFQATFLALARSPAAVRCPGKLGPYLHGVAYRVATKARVAAARRVRRERAAAVADADPAVPESAWDAVMAAVHAEVAALPDHLRVPFVLCCLEGVGVTEAAGRLGWKLGTLSGRLTRAKQLLLDRLAKRGVPAAAVAAAALAGGATAAGVPAGRLAKAVTLAAGGAVPRAILSLSYGVTAMAIDRTKMLAAAVLLAGGLAAGTGWLTHAGAQDTPKAADPNTAQKLAEQIDNVVRLVLADATRAKPAAKWEYDYLPQSPPVGFTAKEIEGMMAERDAAGWTFLGVIPTRGIGTTAAMARGLGAGGGESPSVPTLVFRRPVGATASKPADALTEAAQRLALDEFYLVDRAASSTRPAATGRAAQLEQQIQALQAELAAVRTAKPAAVTVTVGSGELPLPATDMLSVLSKLADARFGADAKKRLAMSASSRGLELSGDAEAIEWARAVIDVVNRKPGTTAKP